ncbi:hypothetical protein JCM12296A_20030 [Desulfosarcina cetonica]
MRMAPSFHRNDIAKRRLDDLKVKRPRHPGANNEIGFTLDGFVKSPISALRVSLVTAAYAKYASFLGIRKP